MEQQGLAVTGARSQGESQGQQASQGPVPQLLSKASRTDPETVVRSNQKSIS